MDDALHTVHICSLYFIAPYNPGPPLATARPAYRNGAFRARRSELLNPAARRVIAHKVVPSLYKLEPGAPYFLSGRDSILVKTRRHDIGPHAEVARLTPGNVDDIGVGKV
jgi:hypothetical protein